MKKKVILFSLLMLLIMLFALADINDTKIDDAYTCLQDKVKEATCEELSLQEQIFSALAIRKCKSEILAEARNDECWPDPSCKKVQSRRHR